MTPDRREMSSRADEAWQPPALSPPTTGSARVAGAGPRGFELQAASAWMDLRDILATARGTLVDVVSGAQPFRPLVPDGVRYVAIDTADAEARFGYSVPDTIYFDGERWPLDDASAD